MPIDLTLGCTRNGNSAADLLPTRPLCTVPFPRVAKDVALPVLVAATVPTVQDRSIARSIVSHCRNIPVPWCRRSLRNLLPHGSVPFPKIRKALRCRSGPGSSTVKQDHASATIERHAVVAPSSRPLNARSTPGRSVPKPCIVQILLRLSVGARRPNATKKDHDPPMTVVHHPKGRSLTRARNR